MWVCDIGSWRPLQNSSKKLRLIKPLRPTGESGVLEMALQMALGSQASSFAHSPLKHNSKIHL